MWWLQLQSSLFQLFVFPQQIRSRRGPPQWDHTHDRTAGQYQNQKPPKHRGQRARKAPNKLPHPILAPTHLPTKRLSLTERTSFTGYDTANPSIRTTPHFPLTIPDSSTTRRSRRIFFLLHSVRKDLHVLFSKNKLPNESLEVTTHVSSCLSKWHPRRPVQSDMQLERDPMDGRVPVRARRKRKEKAAWCGSAGCPQLCAIDLLRTWKKGKEAGRKKFVTSPGLMHMHLHALMQRTCSRDCDSLSFSSVSRPLRFLPM
ncbi:hypothetical protein B0H63DRAFT_315505 [Podospora didyma]|uniref:Uncharacterized protein n=1 Tax=Podospora didyma TaxID=330526 RepID=A0AAE0N5P4_9PEZI|nr:hypothetical protein B0H63DRAFT_315505 [Podospora didyma]